MSRPSGNQFVLFSQESWENKSNCFPRDLTLSVYYLKKKLEVKCNIY